ncbi:M20/M25/M40 family metallo-hydrolase [uncultured Algimonas sp.]|uniref:M20/M25/M40 family metallo-hydrolase n=1 Tax=uncultured Algimonas sp. TaxID=1547920 RepID=UPI00260EF816|nr:M20/M25/M40 family metallo-hydrolase [uncultured Algimonas sp.]
MATSILAGCQTSADTKIPPKPSDLGVLPSALLTAQSLHSRDDVRRAFRQIEADRARNNREMIELNEIPAPPFGEAQRAARLAAMFRELSLDVSLDDVGNVIARRPGWTGAETVVLGAHIDTVFPIETDVTVRRDGDLFIAPGIGDNTRGLIALLSLARAMDAGGIETEDDVIFAGLIGEEGLGDLKGVKHLYRDGADHPDSFIAIDGGRLDGLVHGAVGSNRYRITYQGPGGHSWGHFGRANPHHALARAIETFAQTALPVTETGPKSSFSVGRIGGGTSINSIAYESWMEVDMRSGNIGKLGELDAVFRAAVQQGLAVENETRTRGPELNVEIDQVGERPAGLLPLDMPIVQNAMAAMRVMGVEPEPGISSTDSNIPISMGLPAVTIARGGRSSGAHSLDETWEDVDAHLGVQQALLLTLMEAGIAN